LPGGCAQYSQCRDRAAGGARLAADWRQSTDKETTMTLEAFSHSLFAPAREGREQSFWRQLVGAIMEGRQRKADEFRSELERRLLGQ
jgi:hypothetical protein